MYPYHYYHYINLPQIPQSILDQVNFNYDEYQSKISSTPKIYMWSDSFNQEINQWCQKNICSEMYWAFQIIRGDLPIHKDQGTKLKFCYLLDTGGDQVITNFYDEDGITTIDSVKLDPYRWHILKVDCYHGVTGIDLGRTRFSITGKIF